MEYGVGSLVTPSHMAIDLRLFKDDMTEKDRFGEFHWFINDPSCKSVGKNCAGERSLAMTPSKFDEKMDEKVTKGGASLSKIEFTVEADRSLIKGLYRKTFDGVIGRAVKLDWHGLGWEYEIGALMPVILTAAGTLKELNLNSNKLRGSCVARVEPDIHKSSRARAQGRYRSSSCAGSLSMGAKSSSETTPASNSRPTSASSATV